MYEIQLKERADVKKDSGSALDEVKNKPFLVVTLWWPLFSWRRWWGSVATLLMVGWWALVLCFGGGGGLSSCGPYFC